MIPFRPIGLIRTPFPEKFGIPRQPGLVTEAEGLITLYPEFDRVGVFDGLEESSHIWLSFLFHHQEPSWTPKVRPPRLGGNAKMGVFATRSPRRPNPLGLSVVKLLSVDQKQNQLRVGGVDLLDGTPILDIKPYVPFTDCRPEATHGIADAPPPRLSVIFEEDCLAALEGRESLRRLITEVLSLDPRPAYHDDARIYGMRLQDCEIKWRVENAGVRVSQVSFEPMNEKTDF